MPIQDIILTDLDPPTNIPVYEKVLRLRVVKDANGKLGCDLLYLDMQVVHEDFDTYTATNIGSAGKNKRFDSSGFTDRTTEEKCIGGMVLDLDEVIDALQLLKNHGM